MSQEEEFIAIAKKYVPDLTADQEDLVRRLARCKRYGQSNVLTRMLSFAGGIDVTCGCSLCVQVTYYNVREAELRGSRPNSVIVEESAAPEKDEFFDQAAEIVRKHKRASTSLLQRELRCTYVKSATLMDQLEAAGVIGPKEGGKPRKML